MKILKTKSNQDIEQNGPKRTKAFSSWDLGDCLVNTHVGQMNICLWKEFES